MRNTNFLLFPAVFSSLIMLQSILPSTATAERWGIVIDRPYLSGSPTRGLDLDDLAERLRQSEALGFFVKLTLKDRLDTLISDFVLFHEGHRAKSQNHLKAKFDGLLKDTVAMLRKEDPALSATIERAHQRLWMVVSDPRKFSAIHGRRTAWQESAHREME